MSHKQKKAVHAIASKAGKVKPVILKPYVQIIVFTKVLLRDIC